MMKHFRIQLIVIIVGLLLFGISFALKTIDKPEPAAPVWGSNCELIDGNYYIRGSLPKEMCTHADAAAHTGLLYKTGLYMGVFSLVLIFIGSFWLIVGFVMGMMRRIFKGKNS